MNINPAEIGLLIQINQQQKEKIANMEKEKTRFQTVMAEVKLSYEQRIQTLEGELKKLALIMTLTGHGGLFQSGQSNDGDNDQEQNKGDLQGSGSINENKHKGQSTESVSGEKEKVINELKQLNDELMRRLNEQKEHNERREQGNKSHQVLISLKESDISQKNIQELRSELEESHNQLNDQKRKSEMMVQEISRLQKIIQELKKKLNKQQSKDGQLPNLPSINRQSSDLCEKSELQEELNKLLLKDKQHQSELDLQIKKIIELEESMRTLRRQKDTQITNLKKEFEDAENRYGTEMTNIRHALESSRMKTDHEAQQIKTLLKNEESNSNRIENHLQQVFENRKDRIAKGEKQNTYDDLAETLIKIVHKIHNQYQATIMPKP